MKKMVTTHVRRLGVSNNKYYITYAFIHLLYSEPFLSLSSMKLSREKKEHVTCRGRFAGMYFLYMKVKSQSFKNIWMQCQAHLFAQDFYSGED